MPRLVGSDRIALVDRLVAEFDAVAAGAGPRAISLESPLGLGKTRLVQELFGRLAATRQPNDAYWPTALDWRDGTDPPANANARPDLLQARKQVEPTPGWIVRGRSEIPWLWWGIGCHRSASGSPMRALKDASDQLRTHLDPLTAKLQQGHRNRQDALDALSAVFDLVGVVNPGSALDAGGKFLGILRRRRERSQQAAAIAADRRIDTAAEGFAEAARIAESLAAVGRAGTPVVLAVDDAHWADAGLVSLLGHLLELERAPALVVTTAWPEMLAADGPTAGTFAGWLRDSATRHPGRMARIDLAPLPASALAELVADVAPRTPPATVDRIAETAGGNPLVLNLLLDLDVVRHDIAADGRIDTSPEDLRRLPSSLRALYHDLWRQLPSGVQRVLALVAIQGPEFLPGFVPEAAVRLGAHDEVVPALEAARSTHHWLRAVTDERWAFAEPQRFELVDDLVDELFTDEAANQIRAAAVDHVVRLKASERWPALDPVTRRLALESHLELSGLLGDDVARDADALADSMVHLAALEVEAGATGRAAELLTGAAALRGTDDVELRAAASELATPATPAAASPRTAGTDEWGRRPWSGWEPRPIPTLTELRPSEVAALVREVVAAEGPVMAGRVQDVLLAASGARRMGRLLRAALDRGVQAAVRRGLVVASVPDGSGSSHRRVLRLPDQPEVVLRQLGPRTASEVPAGEILELGRRVLEREPALTRAQLKVRLATLLGEASPGRALDQLLEAVLPESFGSAAAQADEWGRLPWVGWVSRPVPSVADLRPTELADVLQEIVAAEGPVVVGRAFDLVLAAAGAPRRTATVTKALEGALAAGQRRGVLVAARGRHGHPDTRILRLTSQPEVVLRQSGNRDLATIPHSELAELARRVWARSPDATRDEVKRRVAGLVGAGRYTAAADEWLEFAIAANGGAPRSVRYPTDPP